MDTQNLLFKMGVIRDAELQVWDAKTFGPVSPRTHRSEFVKKSLQYCCCKRKYRFSFFFMFHSVDLRCI